MLGEKKLVKEMVKGVDMVKVVLYKIFTDEFSHKYQNAGTEYYKTLAATAVNEIFGQHNKDSQLFFKDNEDIIINEIIAFGIKHQKLKQPITDSIRVISVVRFILDNIPPEHYIEVSNKAMERGIFIKGGDKPDPKIFLEMAEKLTRDYGII